MTCGQINPYINNVIVPLVLVLNKCHDVKQNVDILKMLVKCMFRQMLWKNHSVRSPMVRVSYDISHFQFRRFQTKNVEQFVKHLSN